MLRADRRSGKIINIASMLSFQGGIRVAAYTAAKSGVAGLTTRARQRVGRARHQRQRHRARLHGHRQHRRPCATTRSAQRRHPRPHPRRPLGRARRSRRRGGVPRLAAPRTTSTATIAARRRRLARALIWSAEATPPLSYSAALSPKAREFESGGVASALQTTSHTHEHMHSGGALASPPAVVAASRAATWWAGERGTTQEAPFSRVPGRRDARPTSRRDASAPSERWRGWSTLTVDGGWLSR